MKLKENLLAYFYLSLASMGAVFPTLANIKFIKTYGPGFDVIKFIQLSSNNPASQSLSFDLLFLASTIFIWMYIESRRLQVKHFWIIILSTFSIAIAFSAPLFLFLRELRMIEINNEKSI